MVAGLGDHDVEFRSAPQLPRGRLVAEFAVPRPVDPGRYAGIGISRVEVLTSAQREDVRILRIWGLTGESPDYGETPMAELVIEKSSAIELGRFIAANAWRAGPARIITGKD